MIDVTHAMVMAAGLGLRMRPLTLTTPKPLIKVKGKPLIGYAFDALRETGVEYAVVNVHYLPDQIEGWCKTVKSPTVKISDERDTILDTGGGLTRALPLLGDKPFFVMNSDSFWIEDGEPALTRLKRAWRDDDMDCLLLLCPSQRTVGYGGEGDFHMSLDGRLARRKPGEPDALAYIGGYLVHPRFFAGAPAGKFSTNLLWDKAIAGKRLYGVVHSGWWLHVGTPESIALAESHMG
jgi:N-acetyl-alpha-D-muramate 1-phosphate uridylyltransferase